MVDFNRIHTDLPLTLNRDFRNQLNESFTILKQGMIELSTKMNQLDKRYDDLKKQKETETQLINDTGATTTHGPRTIDISDSDSHILQ
jgi:predicted  nucleic acid-binding Zn-ribbon protein